MADAREQALIDAVIEWWGERIPGDPGDARLMQALWRYDGDHTEPCPDCDGACGEACAPCTADAGCAYLERWIADWEKKHGIDRAASTPKEPAP